MAENKEDFLGKLIIGLISVIVVISMAMFNALGTYRDDSLRENKEIRKSMTRGDRASEANRTEIHGQNIQIQHLEWKVDLLIDDAQIRRNSFEDLRVRMKNKVDEKDKE